MLGVGILGAGRIASGHAHAVRAVDGLRLVAVAEPNDERRARFTERFGCAGYADHGQLLARDDVDIVLAGLPHFLHAPLVVEALDAGKHTMVEKPMAMTLDECDRMIEAAEAHGVQLMVGHHHHFVPANVAAKELLLSRELGDTVMATETWYKPFGLQWRPAWFLDRATGGGMWWMNGAHMIDRLLFFVGSDIVCVKGMLSHRVLGQSCDDTSMALFQFTDGTYATAVHSGYKHPTGAEWHVGEITATEGMLKAAGNQLWVSKEGKYEPVAVPAESALVREVAAFAECVRTGAEPPVSNAHSRAVVEALLAVEESSRTGREVRIRP
jgi:predicted dehydrogenase